MTYFYTSYVIFVENNINLDLTNAVLFHHKLVLHENIFLDKNCLKVTLIY